MIENLLYSKPNRQQCAGKMKKREYRLRAKEKLSVEVAAGNNQTPILDTQLALGVERILEQHGCVLP